MKKLIFVKLRRFACEGLSFAAIASERPGSVGSMVCRAALLPALVFGALLGFGQFVRAGDLGGADGMRATLAAYVQEIDAAGPNAGIAESPGPAESDVAPTLARGQPRQLGAIDSRLQDDDVYAELRTYAQTLPAEPGILLAQAADKPKKADKPKAADKAKPVTKAESADEAYYVGSKVCAGCHAAQVTAFNDTLMGKIFQNPRNAQEKGGCETCHGPGSAHVKAGGGRGAGGIISFRADDTTRTVEENNEICLSCHERRNQTYWMGSTHEQRQVACTNCHQVMQRVSTRFQLAKSTELEVCFQCHKEKRAQIMLSAHMPLGEGKMTCSNCHNPHGSATEGLLVADSINDVCYKCHAEKRGPFLWEHPPVRENCLNCHNPHGTANEYMLNVARPRLCEQCHTQGHGFPGSPMSRFMVGNACQNCHSEIHGSNNPSGPRFQR